MVSGLRSMGNGCHWTKRSDLAFTASDHCTLAGGDLIRITHNGYSADKGKHRLNNGTVYRINKFNAQGNIILDNGWKIDRDWGHIASGFVVTSHSSQGRGRKVRVRWSKQPFVSGKFAGAVLCELLARP